MSSPFEEVSEDGSCSSASTQRSKTVCFLCRRRKVKCDRRKPSCSFCVKNGAQCQYVVSEKKRGLRAGYVSQLEIRLERLEAEFRDLKNHMQQSHLIPSRPQNMDGVSVLSHHPISPTLAVPPIQCTTNEPSRADFIELCNVWFDKFHRWFPILHQASLLQTLQYQSVSVSLSPHYQVLKAIAAVTLPHVGFVTTLSHDQRRVLSAEYAQNIAIHAMEFLSLSSLQAVLIISVLEFGNGKLSKFWNLIALCKRIAMQLGLRDLVVHQCSNFNCTSMLPPRMLPLPNTLIDQEEKTRAYWMTEILDGSSTMGVAWNVSLTRPPPSILPSASATTSQTNSTSLPYEQNMPWLAFSDELWTTMPEFCISVASFGDLETSASFTSYVNLVVNELYIVHQFLQQPFDRRTAAGRAKWQAECKGVDERLQKWRSSSTLFNSAVKSCHDQQQQHHHNQLSHHATISSTHAPPTNMAASDAAVEENRDFDPITILAVAMYNMAIIALYQRLAFPANEIEQPHGPFYHAIQRCLDASDEITMVVRNVNDADLENMSPHLIFPLFVAARFFIVHARITGVEVPKNIDLIMYSLRVCGQRWNLARRLGKVLRAALVERQVTMIQFSSLPPQFFDLQYSHLDIDKVLEVWAESQDINNSAAGLVGW